MAGLEGKTAIVVGASSGIGLATARLLHEEGAMVHAAARREAAIVEGVGEGQVSSGRLVTHALDAADRIAVENVIGGIVEESGVDVLVYAAGINVPDRGFERLAPENWESMISTNLSGAYYAMRAAFEPLRASRGLVILIGSVSGMWPDPSGAAYQASKMGLLGLARAAGFEEHQNGVRVSAILPGIVNTPILDNRPSPPDENTREASLDPADVARACLFLATLPPRAYVPELAILPTRLQALGKTSTASPPLPEQPEESEGEAPA